MNWFSTPCSDPYGVEANVLLQFDGWLYGLEVEAMTGLEHLLYGSKHVFLRKGFHFDTMGVLSTLPTIVTVVIGWFCGQMMEKYSADKYLLLRRLLLAGVLCCIAGLAWDFVMPINKKLWTSSYVLYTGGISIIALSASIWLIDIRKWNKVRTFFTRSAPTHCLHLFFPKVLHRFCAPSNGWKAMYTGKPTGGCIKPFSGPLKEGNSARFCLPCAL
ncbi:MAG: hypothetical protein IPJ82_06340 [Lewinellaceae bacterium]|nr:hypothetical protein [Lewinellaceae bacterium]